MKRLSSKSASSGASEKKIKLSQSEVQTLIEQEVHTRVQKNETKLQELIETIQQLDRAVDYESSVQKLEARINTVAKRAAAAVEYMTKTQKKNPLPSLGNVETSRAESEDETMETVSQIDKKSMDKSGGIFEIMIFGEIDNAIVYDDISETTRNTLKKLQGDNEALKAAMADLSGELPPLVLTPYGTPNGQGVLRLMKKEPEEQKVIQNNVKEPVNQCEEPKTVRVKVERESPVKHTHVVQHNCPPLPPTTFPATLSMEAASYNIPGRPGAHIAFIRNPPGLSVLWHMEEDPSPPPMQSYSVFITMEKVKGSGVFPDWKVFVVPSTDALPRCMKINKYKPGHKVCVAVVGKDKFGRYGPYSKIVTKITPGELGGGLGIKDETAQVAISSVI